MRRLRWLPLVVLVGGAVEFLAFIWVAQQIGVLLAVPLAVGLSLLGVVLLSREGLRAWRRLRATSGSTTVGDDVLDGVIGLAAALLLLVPGYLTALAGLLILLPPVRGLARGRARRYTERRVPSHVAGDLFGPRQAKVRRTEPHKTNHTKTNHTKTTPPTTTSTDEVIEGEIVD